MYEPHDFGVFRFDPNGPDLHEQLLEALSRKRLERVRYDTGNTLAHHLFALDAMLAKAARHAGLVRQALQFDRTQPRPVGLLNDHQPSETYVTLLRAIRECRGFMNQAEYESKGKAMALLLEEARLLEYLESEELMRGVIEDCISPEELEASWSDEDEDEDWSGEREDLRSPGSSGRSA